jgi:hypothetical protein
MNDAIIDSLPALLGLQITTGTGTVAEGERAPPADQGSDRRRDQQPGPGPPAGSRNARRACRIFRRATGQPIGRRVDGQPWSKIGYRSGEMGGRAEP